MRDLRRQALESHKTVSRKARSRMASAPSSKANSTANSPAPSRAASRTRSHQVSEDEDYLSDGTWSANSIDEILNGEDVDIPQDVWKTELNVRIEQITNLKRSSTEGRTESLAAYAHILMARFGKAEIETHVHELARSMLKSIKQETTPQEAVKAMKALAVTIVTLDSDTIYDNVADDLRRSLQTSESMEVKVNAIHVLGVAAYFGGAGDEEILDIMTLLLEIIESDGASVDAADEGNVVIAALEEWGLLATHIADLEDETETAMEAFVEQLESADPGVQTAAGENIALLYEKAFTIQDEDEEESDEDDGHDLKRHNGGSGGRYQVYRRQDQLLHTLDGLANVSTRRISKKDRKTLHSSFADIRNSVAKPTRGPGYSTAYNSETGKEYGTRMKVKLNDNFQIKIDKWWKMQRLNALRRILQGGFTCHYDQNRLVSTALPFSMASRQYKPKRRSISP